MAGDNAPIGPQEYGKRLADLCARGGRHSFPRRSRDRWILLHALVRTLEAPGPLAEKTVDAKIQSWLLQTGRALDVDHVALRRALVDEGFLTREPRGAAYRTSSDHKVRVSFDPAVRDIDPDEIVADALARTAERRRLRQQRPDPAD